MLAEPLVALKVDSRVVSTIVQKAVLKVALLVVTRVVCWADHWVLLTAASFGCTIGLVAARTI